MTMRPKLILEIFAVFVPVASCASFAQVQASNATLATPLAASAPTVVPALIPYSGVAVDRDGHSISGERAITFLFYKEQNGGEPLLIETQNIVLDSAGHYTVQLGASRSSGIPLDLFGSGEARWLEVQIAGEAAQPRTLMTSVPYALKAADAATLGGLPASAFVLAGTASRASNTPGSTTTGATTATPVTTVGGTNGLIPVFSGASTITNSLIYQFNGGIGIGRVPSALFDVGGTSIYRGILDVARTADATSSAGTGSWPFRFSSQEYNSTSAANANTYFQIQSEPTGNNTATTGATLNLLYSGGGGTPVETGVYFNPNGTIHFSPAQSFPSGTGTGAPVCIATGGGFGGGGTTFVAPNFTVPAGGGCASWSGFTKTATTVVLTTNGSACLSTDAKQLTLSVSSADPNYLGAGVMASDYIQLNRTGTTGSFPSGTDQGQFSGSAAQVSCSSTLLQLNENND